MGSFSFDIFTFDPRHYPKETLEQVVEEFQAEVDAFRGDDLTVSSLSFALGLTTAEAKIVACLMRGVPAGVDRLLLASRDPRAINQATGGASRDTAKSLVSKARAKLRKRGIVIDNATRGGLYRIQPKEISKIQTILEQWRNETNA